MYFLLTKNIGGLLETEQTLALINRDSVQAITENTIEEAVDHVAKTENINFIKDTLLTVNEQVSENQASFTKQVDSFRSYLKAKHLGNVKPVKAFVKLVNAGKKANREDILKALQSKKNKDIL